MHTTQEDFEKAKGILEAAGMRIEERTALADRTPERFRVPSLSNVRDKIKYKARSFRDLLTIGRPDQKMDIALSAIERAKLSGTVTQDFSICLRFEKLSDDGLVNSQDIKNKLISRLDETLDSYKDRQYYKLTFKRIIDRGKEIFGIFGLDIKKFDPKELDLDDSKALALRTKIIIELSFDLEYYADAARKIISKWDRAYQRTWGRNESIAYYDLPWADKQTTIAESKGNLFKTRRLNEAMERIFEDAAEAGAKQKFEEDFMK